MFAQPTTKYTALLLIALSLFITGCSSMYYATLEQFGVHKRDVLVDRVEDARDDQEKAKEQFQSALERFQAVVEVDAGELEAKYSKLKGDLDRCESRANAVRNRIKDVKDVGEALFKEWQDELEQYTSSKLRRASEVQLQQTRVNYNQLVSAMERAEQKMDPVLSAFRDQVLYLKHNLNAQAIASLQDTAVSLETDVADLIKDMENSIAEANEFIDSMQQ